VTTLRVTPAHDLTTPSATADVCVVIPAQNEELLLGRCIQSVLDAGVAPEHVYVIDDASTDGTVTIAGAFARVNVWSTTAASGKLGAVQTAIARFQLAERYRYLALLDADSHVAPDYFTEVITRFSIDSNVVVVCGAPRSEPHNWLTAYRALEYAVTLRVFRAGQNAVGAITVAPGCASTYATRILPSLDWDARTLVEDMDVTIQIHRRQLGKLAFTPHAITYTQDPRTLCQYIGQLTRWYSGTWQVMLLRNLPFGRQRIDAEFALLAGEGLIYAVLMLALPILGWLYPAAVLSWLVLDQMLWLTLALGFALHERRLDILRGFPLFMLVRVVNCLVLLRTFWSEVIRRKTRREWFSVARYSSSVANAAVETTHA
jgi:poly-beta-1,6-N-acetyl-D-glucosamine synthase